MTTSSLCWLDARRPNDEALHALEPGGAQERQPEREHEDAEQKTDAAVRDLRASTRPRPQPHVRRLGWVGGHQAELPLRLQPGCAARPRPSTAARRAPASRRGGWARWVSSWSSCTFSRRTATFSATTPASRTATSTIQTTPPATPRRACGLRFGAGFGFGRGGNAVAAREAQGRRRSRRPRRYSSPPLLTAARSRADEARGFAASSRGRRLERPARRARAARARGRRRTPGSPAGRCSPFRASAGSASRSGPRASGS